MVILLRSKLLDENKPCSKRNPEFPLRSRYQTCSQTAQLPSRLVSPFAERVTEGKPVTRLKGAGPKPAAGQSPPLPAPHGAAPSPWRVHLGGRVSPSHALQMPGDSVSAVLLPRPAVLPGEKHKTQKPFQNL